MNCIKCGKGLTGRFRKYCSEKCKKSHHAKLRRDAFKAKTGYSQQSIRGLKLKIMFIEEMGGGCSLCGYDRNISALEFHHKDPSKKEFNIDCRILGNSNIDKIRKELQKCILVCSNCHQEIHNPKLTIKETKEMVAQQSCDATATKFSDYLTRVK